MPLADPFAIPRRLLPAARKALAEGRLFWRSTDAQGRPCNGGAADPVSIGVWAPRVEGLILCERGYHLTTDPLRWRGVRVWLCEAESVAGREGDKIVCETFRPLAEVDPARCLDARARVAASRANLGGADLTRADLRGADLRWADLTRADLRGADLRWADLTRADLRGADLRWADLRGADLRGADLGGANLVEADLTGANLTGARLIWADLTGARLTGAYLSGANLTGARLIWADLTGADLGRWERGPDGYARRMK